MSNNCSRSLFKFFFLSFFFPFFSFFSKIQHWAFGREAVTSEQINRQKLISVLMNKYRKNMYFGNNDANKSGASMIFYKFVTMSVGSWVFIAAANVPKDAILFFPTPRVADIYRRRAGNFRRAEKLGDLFITPAGCYHHTRVTYVSVRYGRALCLVSAVPRPWKHFSTALKARNAPRMMLASPLPLFRRWRGQKKRKKGEGRRRQDSVNFDLPSTKSFNLRLPTIDDDPGSRVYWTKRIMWRACCCPRAGIKDSRRMHVFIYNENAQAPNAYLVRGAKHYEAL